MRQEGLKHTTSDGCINAHTQRLGEAAALGLPASAPRPQESEFSMVIMLDGWMARERGPDWGVGPRRDRPQRITWHEIKSSVIYRLEQRVENPGGRGLLLEKFAVATRRKPRPRTLEPSC